MSYELVNYYVNKKQIHKKQLENDIVLMTFLNEKTKHIKKDMSIKEKLFFVYNKFSEYPRCIICGDFVKFNKNKFSDICGQKSCRHKISGIKMKQTKIEKYGCVNTVSKEYLMENYGVENISQLPGVGDKIRNTKLNKTELENNLINEKRKATNIKKYGVESVLQLDEYKEKSKKTCLEKYGVESVLQLDSVRDKGKIIIGKKAYQNILKNTTAIPLFSEEEFLNRKSDSEKLKFKCNACQEIYYSRYADGIITTNCPTCFPNNSGFSKSEKELLEYIKSIFKNEKILENVRLLDIPEYKRKTEIDIYIPRLNIGIEFNGIYYHQNRKKYHFDKFISAKNMGIKLIQINEYDWEHNKKIIKNRLKHILGCNTYSIYARKCIVKEIPIKLKNKFLNKYHIQGEDKSSIKLGAFYKNRLVAIMTFCKPRFNKNFEYELSRFVTISNFKIIGIAGKLFKHFERNYNPTSIISYSKNDYGFASVYSKLGFDFLDYTECNYFYIKHKLKISRYKAQKKKLKNILKNFDNNLSEKQNMLNNKFMIYYDSGNSIWYKNYL